MLKGALSEQLEDMKRTFTADFTAIALYDAINLEMRWRIAKGSLNNRYSNIVIRNDKGICGKGLQLKRTVMITDFPNEMAETAIEYPLLFVEELKSMMATPLFFNGQLMGVLLAGTRHQRQFTGQDISCLETVAAEMLANFLMQGNQVDPPRTELEESHLLSHFFASAQEKYRGDLEMFLLDQRITRIKDDQQAQLITLVDRILETIYNTNDVKVKFYSESTSEEYFSLLFEINQYFDLAEEVFSDLATMARQINGRVELNCETNQSVLSIRFRFGQDF